MAALVFILHTRTATLLSLVAWQLRVEGKFPTQVLKWRDWFARGPMAKNVLQYYFVFRKCFWELSASPEAPWEFTGDACLSGSLTHWKSQFSVSNIFSILYKCYLFWQSQPSFSPFGIHSLLILESLAASCICWFEASLSKFNLFHTHTPELAACVLACWLHISHVK